MTTLVVGGGWAGLAAAVELSRRGHAVTLLEAAKQLGGRARTVEVHGLKLDNGQHLLIGAYHHLLSLLQTIGVEEAQLFRRMPLHLRIHSQRYPRLDLRLPRLPAPLHFLFGVLRAGGLSWRQRLQILRLGRTANRQTPAATMVVADWLAALGQDHQVTALLWEPLCLGVFNTPITVTPARAFVQVLRRCFGGRRAHSDLLFARHDLGNILPEPARTYIEARGGRVRLQARVEQLLIAGQAIRGVRLANGETLEAEHVILALPPYQILRLCADQPDLAALAATLGRFAYAPICTVYLQYPPDTRLALPMHGLHGGLGQWVFDRAVVGQPGLMAVVISGEGPHQDLDQEQLADTVHRELVAQFPDLPAAERAIVIREQRATFVYRPEMEPLRPGYATPVRGCWIAGDTAQTGYPATLEGAVCSGRECVALWAQGAERTGG